MGGAIDVYPVKKQNTVLPFEPEKMNKFLGTDISESDMINYLTRLEFKVEDGKVVVPTFRGDIESMADIAEEVARLYGYDNLPTTMMKGRVVVGGKTMKQKIEDRIRDILTAYGMYETITYSFIDPKEFEMTRIPMDNVVRITNPLGEENSIMRTSMLSSIIKTLKTNYNRRTSSAKIFELGMTYIPCGETLPDEKQVVAMGMYGGCDFFDLKGHVQGLLEDLGIKKITFETESENLSYHPGRCARVLINGETLGVMGQVHPSVAEEVEIDAEIYCAELDFNTLLKHATFDRKYKVLPKFPASSRDIALVIDNSISVGEIEKIIGRNRANILESFKLFDVYAGRAGGQEQKERGILSHLPRRRQNSD